ncbi:MAG TPA: tripartite tricarboxylate transporter substrate binding protein [Candidatus Omnitrophota bacterium]|nr:tripartite tricarboxylate transporter substrate binding protein [Candidatus Omnitrophota bacterium]
MRKPLRLAVTVVAAAGCLALGSPLGAQEKYPSRPIEVIVTFGPGGGADLMGRQVSRLAEPILGVPMPVANISGASGNAGLTRLLTSPPDGYQVATLIALSVSSWAAGLGTAKPDDFKVVAMMQNSPSMLFVPKNSPYKTAQEFLDAAKANPGKLRVATSGLGTQDDITVRYMASKGVTTKNVPFAKPAERYASTVGGHTDALYEEPGDVAQFIKSGDLRPLIVFDKERHESFPDVVASTEVGLDITDLPNFRTIAVPAKTPDAVVQTLANAMNQVLDKPEWQQFCKDTFTCTDKMSPKEAQQVVANFYTTVQGYLKQFSEDQQQSKR